MGGQVEARVRIALAVAMVAMSPALASQAGQGGGQAQGPGCLHAAEEITMQRQRRLEAIQAMQLIERVAASRVPVKPNLRWPEVANVPLLQSLRIDGGPDGDLARKIRWAEVEPLPGWRIIWLAERVVPPFSLTDIWDPCRFTLSSEDRAVIPAPRTRVAPLR